MNQVSKLTIDNLWEALKKENEQFELLKQEFTQKQAIDDLECLYKTLEVIDRLEQKLNSDYPKLTKGTHIYDGIIKAYAPILECISRIVVDVYPYDKSGELKDAIYNLQYRGILKKGDLHYSSFLQKQISEHKKEVNSLRKRAKRV